jgi:hypothetical protein
VLVYYNLALERASQAGEWQVEKATLNGLGRVCEKYNEYEKAQEYYARAEAINKRVQP